MVIDADTVLQIDLHHVEESEDDDDSRSRIVDELAERLPEGADGRAYLAAFGATQLDGDQIRRFGELLERATIGDLWFTPQILLERNQEELCEDAKAFVKEAERHINELKAGTGDRCRWPRATTGRHGASGTASVSSGWRGRWPGVALVGLAMSARTFSARGAGSRPSCHTPG